TMKVVNAGFLVDGEVGRKAKFEAAGVPVQNKRKNRFLLKLTPREVKLVAGEAGEFSPGLCRAFGRQWKSREAMARLLMCGSSDRADCTSTWTTSPRRSTRPRTRTVVLARRAGRWRR